MYTRLLSFFAAGLFFMSSGVTDTSEFGVSIFYDTLNYLSFPVYRSAIQIQSAPFEDVQCIIDPLPDQNDQLPYGDLVDWARDGGKLVLFTTDYKAVDKYFLYNAPVQEIGNLYLYDVGSGKILLGSSYDIINITLVEDTLEARASAYGAANILSEWEYNKICFNNYYSIYPQNTFWDTLPLWFRLVLIQLVLCFIGYLFYHGRRFGKIQTPYEEVERTENEYVLAVSNLYYEARLTHVALENYFDQFILKCASFFQTTPEECSRNIRHYWKTYKLEQQDLLEDVLQIVKQGALTGSKAEQQKKLAKVAKQIESLTNIITLRRDEMWKV